MLEAVRPRWRSCIVAAPGPSLTEVREGPIIVVQDAYRLMPWADVLYGCEPKWWRHHQGTDFKGEKWSTHDGSKGSSNNKTEAHEQWGVRCVQGKMEYGFSLDPSVIHYGNNSGFQAINLAILFGCEHIILVGFDMKKTGGKSHFFGEHPPELRSGTNYTEFVKHFEIAAERLPKSIRIVNATPDTALKCFPRMTFEQAIQEQHELHNQADARFADSGRIPRRGAVQGAGPDFREDGAAGPVPGLRR